MVPEECNTGSAIIADQLNATLANISEDACWPFPAEGWELAKVPESQFSIYRFITLTDVQGLLV